MVSTTTMTPHGSSSIPSVDHGSNSGSPTPAAPSFSGPQPLPDFVFPARPPSSPSASYARSRNGSARPATASAVMDSNPSSMSEHMSQRRSPPMLPSFSFGASTTTGIESSPPISPGTDRTTLDKPFAGHRRGNSEFIGVDGRTGNGDLMSANTTKDGEVVPLPTSSHSPGGRRKGHAHRRSAAISCHDLSSVLMPTNANTTARCGSAPASPSDQERKGFPGIDDATGPKLSQSQSTSDLSTDNAAPIKPATRTRVGFSDNVEFIPRPLSLVSSDTSSTTTIRQGHSVSNSMSSVVSGSITSSPAGKGVSSPASGRSVDEGRPRTAGPVLDTALGAGKPASNRGSPTPSRSSPRINTSSTNSKSHSPVSPKFPKKPWGFFGSDASAEQSPTKSRPGSADGANQIPPVMPVTHATQLSIDAPLPTIERTSSRRSSVTRKSSKKQKRVKAWAGLLSRKPLHRKHSQKAASRRSPTPPTRLFPPLTDITDATPTTREAAHSTFEEPLTQADGLSHVPLQLQTDFASWKPKHVPQPEDDSMSPIIDLDAALGPFNTPSSYDPTWEMITNGPGSSGAKSRRMHSAGASGFMGGGTMYHRRAESAPEFENPRFKFGRLGSTSTMADVFEEDEEEEEAEWEDAKASDKESCTKFEEDGGLGTKRAEDANDQGDTVSVRTGQKLVHQSSKLSGDVIAATMSSLKSEDSSLHEDTQEPSQPIEIVGDDDSRPSSRARSEASSTPQSRHRLAKTLAPVDVHAIIPPFHLALLTPISPMESPRTPMSDTHRIFSTAPSSVSEEQTVESLLQGEPGPELIRMSVDEVPSLSSTNTTVTRDSTSTRPVNFPLRDSQRSASVAGPTITKKRSSMASLSRLISSSHGEKSKLSIESRPASAIEPERKDKTKSKRISRLMNFWRPKSVA